MGAERVGENEECRLLERELRDTEDTGHALETSHPVEYSRHRMPDAAELSEILPATPWS